MNESLLLGIGIVVILLFCIGIFHTIKEFKEMKEPRQREWEEERRNMHVEDKSG